MRITVDIQRDQIGGIVFDGDFILAAVIIADDNVFAGSFVGDVACGNDRVLSVG